MCNDIFKNVFSSFILVVTIYKAEDISDSHVRQFLHKRTLLTSMCFACSNTDYAVKSFGAIIS